MNYLKSLCRHWKTTLLGVAAIVYALWIMRITFNPSIPLSVNFSHVWAGAIALIISGIGLIHASDHDK